MTQEVLHDHILTPEKVIRILEKHGTKVSAKEAIEILNMISSLAKIAVDQYLRDDES